MARCGCAGSSSCSCVVQGGNGVTVAGSGTAADPYVIDSTLSSITGTLEVTDTATVDLSLAGSGTLTDPYDLSAVARVSVGALSDVAPGAPASGDTLLWDGTSWVYGPPSTGGGGTTVTTTSPISGDGSIGNPIALDTSGTWGTAPLDVYGANTLLGAPIYVDANGQVRSQPNGADVLATGAARPNQYPGRLIVQGGVLYYSDGTTWQPLTPTVEPRTTVMAPQWGTAGITLGAGVTPVSDASYASFHRFGPMITLYLNGVRFTPENGGTSSDVTNQLMLGLPATMLPAFAASGNGFGTAGRLANFHMSTDASVYVTAVMPNVTNTTTNPAWPTISTSIALCWQLHSDLDPQQALAPIRAVALGGSLPPDPE